MKARYLKFWIPVLAIMVLMVVVSFRAQARTMSNPDPELGARLRVTLGFDAACVAAMNGDAEAFQLIVNVTDLFAGDHPESITPPLMAVENARRARLHALEVYDDSSHENDAGLIALEDSLSQAQTQFRAACVSLEDTLEEELPPALWNRCLASAQSRLLDPRCGMLSLQPPQLVDLRAAIRNRDRKTVHHCRRATMAGISEAWGSFNAAVAGILTQEQEAQWTAAENQMNANLISLVEIDTP